MIALHPAAAPGRAVKVHFPRDEGAHPGVKTEWWYLNGHLEDDQGRSYGFVHALFDAPDAVDARYNQKLPFMPGVTDLDTGLTRETEGVHTQTRQFDPKLPFERHEGIEKGHLDESFQDVDGEWRVFRQDDQTLHVSGPTGKGKLDLDLKAVKPALLMGGQGEIPMGPYGVSKYYTFPRLEARGTLSVDGEDRPVHGTAWLDHQWGDMEMYNGYKGWDWYGIQLDNGTDINAFRFRDEDGGTVEATAGISHPDGSQDTTENMELTPSRSWKSPKTGVRYPLEWHMVLPDKDISLDFKPILDDQEMVGFRPYSHPELAIMPTYWEGSVAVTGTMQGQPVTGKAYMELVGYTPQGQDLSHLSPETVETARRLVAERASNLKD